MHQLEPALEDLLLRVVPGLSSQWQGASAEEITRIEALAGRPLPSAYQWFLSRMGKSMGPMSYPTVDFSARGVLAAYAARRIEPHPRFLLIGYEEDEVTPLHYFYDLDRPARGDALVVRMITPRDESHEQFETFREMLAWGELWSQRVEGSPQQCRGTLRVAGAPLHTRLEPVMARLGFATPIETGPCCGLYERSDAALIWSGTPTDAPGPRAFGLGGRDAATLAQVIAALTAEAIDIAVSTWSPALPGSA